MTKAEAEKIIWGYGFRITPKGAVEPGSEQSHLILANVDNAPRDLLQALGTIPFVSSDAP